MDIDVLIVGAGPTGLMLANQLGRRGIRTQIIDRNAGPALHSRALGVQARTLEIYTHLGIAAQAVELGKRATGANIWAEGKPKARLPLGDIGRDLSPFPFLLILGQDDNERLLGGLLSQWGNAVQWETELVALTQDDHQVRATLKRPDGTIKEVAAAWIAGCDGARSTVRDLNKIEFQGAPYEHVFFVADTEVTGSMRPDEVNVYLWRDGFHLFFPMRGKDHWRIAGILPAHLRGRDDLIFDEVIPHVRQEVGTELSFKRCGWFSTYRIHHRRAERFREGRCFLLGDAAHIHSPIGAQGMNTGLQDAYNLAWKLALVVSGRASPPLLDSYEAERIPVARRLLSTTDRAFSMIVSDGWLPGLLRTKFLGRVLAFAIGRDRFRKFAFRTISQTGIQYRNSPLSSTLRGLPETAPRAGDRLPWIRLRLQPNGPIEDLFEKLDDTKFTLIVFGQAASAIKIPELGGLLWTLEVPSDSDNDRELMRAHIPRSSFYLVRPDGYVGLTGPNLELAALQRYGIKRLRLNHPMV